MCRLPICMGKSQTFYVMMVLTTSMFFVEITVGYLTKSMALVADSFHMLSDIISLFVGYFSFKFSKKKKNNLEKDTGNTFGWARAEVLGALINGIFLLALCFSILIEGVKRLVTPEKLEKPIFILTVGTVGLVVNLVGMCLFHGHTGHTHSHGGNKEEKTSDPPTKESYNNEALEINLEPYNDIDMKSKQLEDSNKSYMGNISIKHGSFVSVNIDSNTEIREIEGVKAVAKTQKSKSSGQMNMKGVYLHLLGDALGSIVVIFAALIVYFFDGKQWTLYVDPGMSILMVIIITKTVIPLVKQSSMILMQNAPSSIQINTIEDKLLLKFPEIQSVHEFHVWQLTDSKLVASLHVELRAHSDYSKIAFMLKEFFHDEGIHSTTIQPEYAEKTIENGTTCRLQCSSLCEEKLCCLIEYTNSDVTSTDYRPERCSVSDVTSIDQNDVASIDKNANDIYNTQF